MVHYLLFALALARVLLAQSATKFTDPASGIEFVGNQDLALTAGIVVPESTTGSDFIGHIVATKDGYGGLSFGGQMAGTLLVVAWASGNSVISSVRTVDGYTAPTPYENSAITLLPIANGTYVNATHFSYTFICGGCLSASVTPKKFSLSDTVANIGYAASSRPVTNPSSGSTGTVAYHDLVFGSFAVGLADARSPSYSLWASWAIDENGGGQLPSPSATSPTTPSPTPLPGNSTVPGNGTTPGGPSCSTTEPTASNITYDYIVAGGGPAGIIAAQRLAESGKSVLLIERGKASNYASGGRAVMAWNDTVTQYDVPGMAYYLSTAADTSGYCTDVASQAGCILGGGSSVNAFMFVRPQKLDFDDKWPTGWKWNDVSAAAERLYKRNPGTSLPSKDGQRYDQQAFRVLSTFLSSAGFKQVDTLEDPDSKTRVFSYPSWSISNGLRQGPVVSYLPLAKALPNFTLSLQTKVIRVLRNKGTITGVEVELPTGNRQIVNIKDGGSVILSAGTLSTPRILFNSGIGPEEQIAIVKNSCGAILPPVDEYIKLPVGQNLRDHPVMTLKFDIKNSNDSSLLTKDFTSPSQTNIDLFAQASGPLVQSGQRLVFFSSLTTASGTRYFQGTCNSPAAGVVQMKIYLTHGASSVGSLGITATQTTTFIKNPLFTTEEDKAAAAQFIDSILNAARNSTIISVSDPTLTGAKATETFVSGSHFVGSTIMGPDNDGTAVVDLNTKVYGTENLFVVDASIHPDLPTGNTQAPVMIVAERAIERILGLDGEPTPAEEVPSESATPGAAGDTCK